MTVNGEIIAIARTAEDFFGRHVSIGSSLDSDVERESNRLNGSLDHVHKIP